MRIKSLLSAALCTMLVFTLGYGQRMQRPGAGASNGMLVEKLKLSDSQKADFEKINTDFARQRIEQQAKIKLAALDLRTLLNADSPDKSAIEKKINEISDLQAQNRMLRVDHWFSVNKILNPDQQKIWKSMLDRPLRGRFAAGMGQMRGGAMMQGRGMMRNPQRPMTPGGWQQ